MTTKLSAIMDDWLVEKVKVYAMFINRSLPDLASSYLKGMSALLKVGNWQGTIGNLTLSTTF